MRQRLTSCQALVIESNHEVEMLKNGSYPPYLKQRIRSNQGHLDNDEAAAFMKELLHDSLSHVVLAHLSQENNDPGIAYQVMHAALDNVLANQDMKLRISVAEQDRAGELVEISAG
jgi:phosphoribosyl 1,2-cyclic phosphodiesterase